MALTDDIIEGEVRFPRRFACVEPRDYGLLYHTPEIPDSHDGNHACILHARDIPAAIADVEDFYCAKGLKPRVKHHCRAGEGQTLRAALQAAGYQVWDEDQRRTTFYVRRRPSRIRPNPELAIHRVRTASPELLAMVAQSNCERAAKVIRRSLQCPDYHLLVGFLDGRPVAKAAVEPAGPACRVDNVLTHKPFRGRGYCRALMHELVAYHARVLGGVLNLYTDNPIAAHIYEEAGFVPLDEPIEFWSAVRESCETQA